MSRDIFAEINNFIDSTPAPTNDVEYFKAEEAYTHLFGHGVPTEMLPPSVTRERIIEAMRLCIEAERDNLLQILNVTVNADFKY